MCFFMSNIFVPCLKEYIKIIVLSKFLEENRYVFIQLASLFCFFQVIKFVTEIDSEWI